MAAYIFRRLFSRCDPVSIASFHSCSCIAPGSPTDRFRPVMSPETIHNPSGCTARPALVVYLVDNGIALLSRSS
jgi:hypothetical protein